MSCLLVHILNIKPGAGYGLTQRNGLLMEASQQQQVKCFQSGDFPASFYGLLGGCGSEGDMKGKAGGSDRLSH